MKKMIFEIAAILLAGVLVQSTAAAPEAQRVYLSGKGPDDAVEWDFFCSKGRKSGEWTKIPVPSNWEQEGFGNYNYGHDIPKHDETGTYRATFMVPEEWKQQHVRLVFEGVMTQTEIKINGKPVGVPNLGGYIPFRFNLDEKLLKYGEENELEVLVKKKPDNESPVLYATTEEGALSFSSVLKKFFQCLEKPPKCFSMAEQQGRMI